MLYKWGQIDLSLGSVASNGTRQATVFRLQPVDPADFSSQQESTTVSPHETSVTLTADLNLLVGDGVAASDASSSSYQWLVQPTERRRETRGREAFLVCNMRPTPGECWPDDQGIVECYDSDWVLRVGEFRVKDGVPNFPRQPSHQPPESASSAQRPSISESKGHRALPTGSSAEAPSGTADEGVKPRTLNATKNQWGYWLFEPAEKSLAME